MSKKRRKFNAEFKKKVILKMFEENLTINEVASEYNLHPKTVQLWKKQFIENAELAFDKSSVVKEYKEEIEKLQKEKERLAKKLGEVIVEKDWAVGKLKSLDLSIKKEIIDSEGKVQADKEPSLNKKLKLLDISKTAYYYEVVEPFSSEEDKNILNEIDRIHTDYPYYGTRRVVVELKNKGLNVGRKLVKKAFEYLGICALYPKPKTTIANRLDYKYPYLLKNYKNEKGLVKIDKVNEVWSSDITYIKLEKGFAYLCAIIDWHTKKILSWKISNTMDVYLTTSVLKDALNKYPKPKIFNSDQGSQYTAKEHIEILKNHNISISMDARGRSIDNIVIERFWRTIKYENIYPTSYNTIKEARDGINQYINFYNTKRIHSAIEYKTPDEVYNKWLNDLTIKSSKSVA
jgi:putative transposase